MQQSLRSRVYSFTRASTAVVAMVAGFGAVLSWTLSRSSTVPISGTFIAFSLFVAVADLLDVPLERRAVFSLGLAPAIGFGLYRHCTELGHHMVCDAWPPLGEVAAVFLLGSACSMLVRAARRQDLRLQPMTTRLIVVLAASSLYRAIEANTRGSFAFGPPRMSVLGLAGVLVGVVTLHVLLDSLHAASEGGTFAQEAQDQLRSTGPLLLSTLSVGALLALAYPALKNWTLPVFLVPLAATQFSFRQVARIRTNYRQTVAALAKVPEMAGYTERGHSRRVAQLSFAIAKELGTGEPELDQIEYGALLHDIGRISIPDPEAGVKSTSTLQLALVGAGIIEETGHFPVVARMVRDQHEPYRRRGEDVNRSISLGAKIIKVASAFDDLTHPGGPGRTPWDALEKLHMGMAYEYDPAVIQALTKVLERDDLV